MAIPQEYIAELSRRTDITELVRGYVQLKRAGRMEKGLCPFHGEKTPSFYVYPDTASFYCFGCGAGGDAITFMKLISNLSYVEAVKALAARAGMPLPDEDDTQTRARGRILAANREAAKFYAEALNTDIGRPARGYLRQRGLSDAVIRRFGLGFARDEGGALRDRMKGLGFSEEELLLAGLCKKSERGGLYDAFRSRVIFPIIDLRGTVIAFGGRIMGEARGPKYLNSADTPVFKKSKNLFALNIARKSGSRRLILAEGYMDVISLHQAGFTEAVAALGTAFTAEQARMVQSYADEAVLCYDSDEAGRKAAARAIELFKNTAVRVRVVQTVGAKDPDEFIKTYGAQRFARLVEQSGNALEYRLQRAKAEHDITAADGRAAYIRAATEILAAEAMPAEQDIYAGRIAQETDVDKARIIAQLEGVVRERRRRAEKEREKRLLDKGAGRGKDISFSAGGAAVGVAFAEQQLVAAILKNPGDFLQHAAGRLSAGQFISPDMAEVYALLLRMGGEGAYIDLASMSGLLPDRTVALLGRVLAQNHDIGFSLTDVTLFIDRILNAGAAADRRELTDEQLRDYIAKKGEWQRH